MLLLGGNYYVLAVLFEPNERTRFEIIVPAVCDKIFYELPRKRVLLHLVEDDERLALIQRYRIVEREFLEEQLQISRVVNE